jgi:hypothetical protein
MRAKIEVFQNSAITATAYIKMVVAKTWAALWNFRIPASGFAWLLGSSAWPFLSPGFRMEAGDPDEFKPSFRVYYTQVFGRLLEDLGDIGYGMTSSHVQKYLCRLECRQQNASC